MGLGGGGTLTLQRVGWMVTAGGPDACNKRGEGGGGEPPRILAVFVWAAGAAEAPQNR